MALLMFVGIYNPDAVNIRIFNPKKRIENAYTQSGRIANPPERGHERVHEQFI